jgi:hypothetical protein
MTPEIATQASSHARAYARYFSDTNGTDDPGTIVVGSTPFQRSACKRDQVRIGAERLSARFDGGGFGFAGDLDVGRLNRNGALYS